MEIKRIMDKVHAIDSELTVSQVARQMKILDTGSVVVKDGSRYVGLITERDLIRKVLSEGKNPLHVKAKDIMNKPLITISSDEKIEKASRIMSDKNIRRLLVEENGRIIGKLTQRRISNNMRFLLAGRVLNRMKSQDYNRPGF
jgi:CBS domain-containing protein